MLGTIIPNRRVEGLVGAALMRVLNSSDRPGEQSLRTRVHPRCLARLVIVGCSQATVSLESQEFLGICPMRKATWIGLSQDRSGRVGRPIFSGKRRVTSITEGTNSSALVHRQHAEETDTPRKVMPGEVTAIAPGVEGRL